MDNDSKQRMSPDLAHLNNNSFKAGKVAGRSHSHVRGAAQEDEKTCMEHHWRLRKEFMAYYESKASDEAGSN